MDRERERPSAQRWSNLNNIPYTTMQTFMGGYLVNYFNRFGRQWQTYVEAEGDTRANIQNINQFLRLLQPPTAAAFHAGFAGKHPPDHRA